MYLFQKKEKLLNVYVKLNLRVKPKLHCLCVLLPHGFACLYVCIVKLALCGVLLLSITLFICFSSCMKSFSFCVFVDVSL